MMTFIMFENFYSRFSIFLMKKNQKNLQTIINSNDDDNNNNNVDLKVNEIKRNSWNQSNTNEEAKTTMMNECKHQGPQGQNNDPKQDRFFFCN